MNYEKLTAGLSKEEIKAIYNNWLNRLFKIYNLWHDDILGWVNIRPAAIYYQLLNRLSSLEIHLKVYFT